MTKPIGNLIANLTPYDKVSSKIKAKYGPQSATPPSPTGAASAPSTNGNAAKRPRRHKERKR